MEVADEQTVGGVFEWRCGLQDLEKVVATLLVIKLGLGGGAIVR